VVEDEDFVRDLMREILEESAHHVITASNGNEALDLLSRADVDAVFTDVGLPGMNGWELAKQIRAARPELPIAIITGWGDAVGSDELREQHINWVVTKPFTVERLMNLAGEVVRQRDGAPVDEPVALIEHDATDSDVLN
jgi:DNA-binding response OmpR family regulator